MPAKSRHPEELASPPTTTVPGYTVHTTACQFCVVGCGYEAHTWDGSGSDAPPDLMQAHWVSPAMTERIRVDGDPRTVAVVPDPKCPMNKGNHSVRGGTQGRALTFSAEKPQDELD